YGTVETSSSPSCGLCRAGTRAKRPRRSRVGTRGVVSSNARVDGTATYQTRDDPPPPAPASRPYLSIRSRLYAPRAAREDRGIHERRARRRDGARWPLTLASGAARRQQQERPTREGDGSPVG